MKINCSKCNRIIKINRTQINKKILNFFDKTGLYLCGYCRRELKIQLDAEATIKKLKEIQKNAK